MDDRWRVGLCLDTAVVDEKMRTQLGWSNAIHSDPSQYRNERVIACTSVTAAASH